MLQCCIHMTTVMAKTPQTTQQPGTSNHMHTEDAGHPKQPERGTMYHCPFFSTIAILMSDERSWSAGLLYIHVKGKGMYNL